GRFAYKKEMRMKRVQNSLFAVLILAAMLLSVVSFAQGMPRGLKAGGERHPAIHQAIQALEAAKGDLQNAAHDYCGHRVAALESANRAINQLGLAIQCDRTSDASGPVLGAVPVSAGSAGERHPNIRRAVNALERAKTDLQNAAHDFCGHRVEALEAV